MRSKAHIKSHPLHPILIPFPIAFFTGTFLFHIAALLLNNSDLFKTATYLNIAGIVFSVLAAIPGLIDLIYTVPPDSSAKKRGVKHGLFNTVMLLAFIVAYVLRSRDEVNHTVILLLETTGITLMVFAGWMGGTLVYRNQIGVDVRYANSAKWNEAYFENTSGSIEVASTDELKINAMKLLHINGQRIVLARTETGFVAFDDRCPHKGGSLVGGSIMCGTVQCPWHGSQFSVSNGIVTQGPSKEGIKTYIVDEDNGKLFLHL